MVTRELLDEMESFCAALLIQEGEVPITVVRKVALRFPNEHALTYSFVLTWIASMLDTHRDSFLAEVKTSSEAIVRAQALLAADAFELEIVLGTQATGDALIAHWAKHDPR